jgi:hypothetical protein
MVAGMVQNDKWALNPEMLQRQLGEAERRATEGARQIAEQQDRMEKLRRRGANRIEAERALAVLLETQERHRQDLAKIEREIEKGK